MLSSAPPNTRAPKRVCVRRGCDVTALPYVPTRLQRAVQMVDGRKEGPDRRPLMEHGPAEFERISLSKVRFCLLPC